MEQSDKNELTVELAEMGTDQLCLRISDTGCGIPEDVQNEDLRAIFIQQNGSRQERDWAFRGKKYHCVCRG